jgi:2',3'-cyclic-nucleotide 2'-phosphodiesterase (5'-nucleotidase family)
MGKVFELMPFDNAIVILELDGATTAKLFDKMSSAGGWPVAGASYEIKKDNAVNIHIQGKVFDITKTYRLAVTDYLANGGDNLDFLKGIPQHKCNIIYRDGIMEYVKALTAANQKINSQTEGRVKNAQQEIIH